jgi:hypothetical protein
MVCGCSGESQPLAGGGASGSSAQVSAGRGAAGSGETGAGNSSVGASPGGGVPSFGGRNAGGGRAGRAGAAMGGSDARGGEVGAGAGSGAAGGSTSAGASGRLLEAGASGTAALGGGSAEGGAGAGGADTGPVDGRPCDIYASNDVPCVAAYSMVRALFEAYDGPLYQVRRADGAREDIGVLAAGSVADAAAQDAFCGESACTVSVVYDQSGQGNHLTQAPPDCYLDTLDAPSNESDAKGRVLDVGGHRVYALHMIAHDGYRANDTTGMPTGSAPQSIYEVVDGKRFGSGCCWDFGNGSTNNCASSVPASNALFFGTGYWGTGAGDGPWFMADFEKGVWAGGDGASTVQNPDLPASTFDYAFGALKTGPGRYTLRVANAQAGELTTAYDGGAPIAFQMQGAVILGLSSDASDASYGTFFEGAITSGTPSSAVDRAVLRNVQAAGYGK